MPVNPQIAIAAYSFNQNAALLPKSIEGLTAEEWFHRPNESSNHMAWIVGHMIWARGAVIGLLGAEWTQPWPKLFARGVKVLDPAEYPAPEQIMASWKDVTERLNAAMEAGSEETLAKPGPERIPSADGKVSGVVNFLAHHDTYHIGQLGYLRTWLGHPGIVG